MTGLPDDRLEAGHGREEGISSSMGLIKTIIAGMLLLCLTVPVVAQRPPQLERPARERDRNAPNRPERDRDEELAAKRRIERDLEQAQFRANHLYLISKFELGDIGIGSELYIPADEQLDGVALSFRAPQRLYYIANRRTLFSLDVEPGYVMYIDSDRENQLSWLLRGDVHFLFPSFYVNGFVSVADELLRDNSEFTRLVPRDTTAWGVNTEFKPSSRTQLASSYIVRDIKYDANEDFFFDRQLELLERTASQFKLEGRHHTFPITHTLLGVMHTDYDFDKTPTRNASQIYYYVGADREIGDHRFVARVGYSELDYRDSEGQDYSGFLGDAALDMNLSSRNDLAITYRRDLQFSVFANNNHYLADRLFLNDVHKLTDRLSAHLQAQAGLNSYEVPIATPSGPLKREDELYYIGAGPSYQFFDRVTLGFVVGPWERRSNIPGQSDDGIRWQILLSFN